MQEESALWLSYHDPEQQRDYYYNTLTQETVWELPPGSKSVPGPDSDSQDMLTLFKPHEKHVKYSHLLRPISWTEGKQYMKRPARKQLDKPYIKNFAYQQGDEEYNIYYDKYLNDKGVRDREPAATRCDPEKDVGYTKADLYDPDTSYLCLHFVRGCCCEGGNCRYFHHMPSLEECKKIDPLKDIFGRTRHAKHREDMGGIGCFQKECRTLYVADLKLPPGNDPVDQVNEMLWRHFSIWGRVEDITFIPSKCIAFVKYYHRCYAEIAKEAMSNQALDFDEMISIKWANDDPNPSRESQYSEAWHKAQIHKDKESKVPNKSSKQEESKEPKAKKSKVVIPKNLPPPVDITHLQDPQIAEELKKADEQAKRMQRILDRISREQPDTLAEIVFPSGILGVEEDAPRKKLKTDD